MRTTYKISILVFLVIALSGCSAWNKITKVVTAPGRSIGELMFPSYSGLKAQVAVTDMELKTPKADSDVSSGLRAMLIKELISTNRFIIVDAKSLAEADTRQQASNVERPKGLIINSILTSFEPVSSGGRLGVGGGGGINSGIFGGIFGSGLNKAYIKLQIVMVDSFTSKVLQEKTIQGQASDEGSKGSSARVEPALDKSLATYGGTAMEKAIKTCMLEAARFISTSTPQDFYKYR